MWGSSIDDGASSVEKVKLKLSRTYFYFTAWGRGERGEVISHNLNGCSQNFTLLMRVFKCWIDHEMEIEIDY